MLKIESVKELDGALKELIDSEFNQYAIRNNLSCNYTPFNFLAKEEGEVVGILTGYTIYEEVRVDDLIVLEKYRSKGIGRQLMNKVETRFKGKGFNNINLVTNAFQAPGFYKK